jgi:hypothetical protein
MQAIQRTAHHDRDAHTAPSTTVPSNMLHSAHIIRKRKCLRPSIKKRFKPKVAGDWLVQAARRYCGMRSISVDGVLKYDFDASMALSFVLRKGAIW